MKTVLTISWGLVFSFASMAPAVGEKTPERSPAYLRWHNPKIRPWQDYPFFPKPENTLHKELWEDFKDIPVWGQRGHLVYCSGGSFGKAFGKFAENKEDFDKGKQAGVSLVHVGPIKKRYLTREIVDYLHEIGLPLVLRLDGQYFWGRNYNELMSSLRFGGWDTYHNTVPNNDWYRKFPPSLAATRVLRDGQPIIEYYGSKWVQRRDLSYMHPVSIQMRDGFLRECVLGEQVFDRPLDLEAGGKVSGVWWDNPGNVGVSYDPYSLDYIAREFEKKFGDRYSDPKDKLWYCDPPSLWMRHRDPEIQRWWESVWADAYAGYYAWQYRFIQEELAPKLGKKHIFVGGNSKLCWSSSSWDYYLFSWPTYDLLGPNETTVVYSDKHAPGFKLALAASNGKPAGLWTQQNQVAQAEALACLGIANNLPGVLRTFQATNFDLYHNAKPGGRVAVLYHLEDGLHHNEIANICRVTDQIWRSGVPLEIITERHLSQRILEAFDLVVVPGFRLTGRNLEGLRGYLTKGGRLLLIGDNTAEDGKQLARALGGEAPLPDGGVAVGEGHLQNFGSQLITQAQMAQALKDLNGAAFQMTAPEQSNVLLNILTQPKKKLLNILTQPKKKLLSVHLVNFTGKPVRNAKARLPADLKAQHVAFISPYGANGPLSVSDRTVTIPVLDIYGVIVVCPSARTRDKIISRNQALGGQPTEGGLPTIGIRGNMPGRETKLSDLKPGQKVCHLRQFSKAGFRRVDADIITHGTGKVGQPQDLALKIHAVGVWAPNLVHLDKVSFVMARNDGYRESVPVPMAPLKTEEAADVREKDFAMPTATFVRRESTVSWTPKEPGLYQAYLSYRYVSEIYEGKPDTRAGGHYKMHDYFWSRPLPKIVYEDKLPCLTVEVK